jgi:hypothetical protein
MASSSRSSTMAVAASMIEGWTDSGASRLPWLNDNKSEIDRRSAFVTRYYIPVLSLVLQLQGNSASTTHRFFVPISSSSSSIPSKKVVEPSPPTPPAPTGSWTSFFTRGADTIDTKASLHAVTPSLTKPRGNNQATLSEPSYVVCFIARLDHVSHLT